MICLLALIIATAILAVRRFPFLFTGWFWYLGTLVPVIGIVAMSKLLVGDAKIGDGLEFDAITAVVLGGTSLFGGQGKLLGVLVGAVFMGTLGAGLHQDNVDSNYQTIIKGAVLILAVLLDTALRRRSEK